ncbi:MAG TPA: hypothetical protein QF764_12545 [Planctomycetota bacterium]|jgi:nicotinamidase-related amidase|nr:hypothetical protein [Planctomycetota bacterium]
MMFLAGIALSSLAASSSSSAACAPQRELEITVLASDGTRLTSDALLGAVLTLHATALAPDGTRVVLPGEARTLSEQSAATLAVEPGTHAVAVTLRGRPAGLFEAGIEVLESLVEVGARDGATRLVLRSRAPDSPRGRLLVNMRAVGRLLRAGSFHLASPLTGTLLDPRPRVAGGTVAPLSPLPCFEWIELPAGAYVLVAAAPPDELGGVDWAALAAPRLTVDVDPHFDRVANLVYMPGGDLRLSLSAASGALERSGAAQVCLARAGEGIARPLFPSLVPGESGLSPRLPAGDHCLFVLGPGAGEAQIAVRIETGSTVEVPHTLGETEDGRMEEAAMEETMEGSAGSELTLHARRRVATDGGASAPQDEVLRWDPARTALVICDMWDDHWCAGAARRVEELAGAVNELAAAARERGVTILHAPSSVVSFYDGTPQRERARAARYAEPPRLLSTDERWGTAWCWPDPSREPAMPVDDANMGCACEPRCSIRDAWTRQIATIEIAAEDVITDHGQETYNVFAQRGIENVMLVGVHLNMCVLGRPFGIRQMVQVGKNVVLVRDLTDTMYDPRMAPFVSHFEGTDLVVGHVERYWCPSIESSDLTGRPAFRFRR